MFISVLFLFFLNKLSAFIVAVEWVEGEVEAGYWGWGLGSLSFRCPDVDDRSGQWLETLDFYYIIFLSIFFFRRSISPPPQKNTIRFNSVFWEGCKKDLCSDNGSLTIFLTKLNTLQLTFQTGWCTAMGRFPVKGLEIAHCAQVSVHLTIKIYILKFISYCQLCLYNCLRKRRGRCVKSM